MLSLSVFFPKVHHSEGMYSYLCFHTCNRSRLVSARPVLYGIFVVISEIRLQSAINNIKLLYSQHKQSDSEKVSTYSTDQQGFSVGSHSLVFVESGKLPLIISLLPIYNIKSYCLPALCVPRQIVNVFSEQIGWPHCTICCQSNSPPPPVY